MSFPAAKSAGWAIAGVIAMNPEVLILDEPTAGLDPKGRDRILGQILEYHKEQKNTILLVSHSMEDVAKYTEKGAGYEPQRWPVRRSGKGISHSRGDRG